MEKTKALKVCCWWMGDRWWMKWKHIDDEKEEHQQTPTLMHFACKCISDVSTEKHTVAFSNLSTERKILWKWQ